MTMSNDPIELFRSSFAKVPGLMHANNAGVAPLSLPAAEAVKAWTDRFSREGMHCALTAIEETERTRVKLARTLGSKPEEVAFFQSAAGAISQVALGLELKAGDEIVVWDQEYPSNFHPWRIAAERAGAKVVVAKSPDDLSMPLERIQDAVTPRTKVIAMSWVQYRTGAIMDLKPLTDFARARGIFTCSDIIQGAGLLPFDFRESGLDAACGGSHKWFVSPISAGYLLIKESRIPEIRPTTAGAMSFGTPDSLPTLNDVLKPGAQRFEPGSRGLLELIGLGASLDLIEKVGIARIGQEVEWLARLLMHELREIGYVINSPHGAHHRGSIVNFKPGLHSAAKTEDEIDARLKAAKISFGRRPPGVRLSLHAFNTKDDVDRLIEILS
ncbi:MAG: aminotransferase class V-fold PLP-dependent enzyme [Bdellovibrionota bacterium]